MSNLQNLDLSGNRIISLALISAPSLFSNNPKLEILNLSSNPLTHLGDNFEEILYSESLLELDVSGCSITQIRGTIALLQLPKLVQLNLSHNRLTRLEGVSSNSLISLDISDNDVQFFISDSLSGLKNLQRLQISGNKQLTDQYFKLSSKTITRVDLSYCSVHTNYASDMPKIHTAIMTGNSILKLVAGGFRNNTKLVRLDLSDNRIKFVHELAFDGAETLRYLDLSRNSISTLDQNTFLLTPVLSYLNLSSNLFGTFAGLKLASLTSLDLSSCKIDSFPTNLFNDSPHLTILNMSYNFFEKLPENLTSRRLQTIDLSYCRLTTIYFLNFHHLEELKEINLSGNRLLYIRNNTFSNNHELNFLQLDDNPWKCDCQDEDLQSFWIYLTQPPKVSNQASLICQYPENISGWTWQRACSDTWSTTNSHDRSQITILLLVIVAVLMVGGLTTCVIAVWETRTSSSNNRQLERVIGEHCGTIAQIATNTDANEQGSPNEPPLKSIQLPSYAEAVLLSRPQSTSSGDIEITIRNSPTTGNFKKRQSATQTDECIVALLSEEQNNDNEAGDEKMLLVEEEEEEAKNSPVDQRINRSSYSEMEYIEMRPLSVQCTEL